MPEPTSDRAHPGGVYPVPDVRTLAGHALAETDLDAKAAAVDDLATTWAAWTRTSRSGEGAPPPPPALVPVDRPGRGSRPELVAPRHLPARRLTTPAGRVAAIHAVAHIEANAVNLALDAVHRFDDLPAAFYGDWIAVAAEEAHHFALLRARLRDLGADYGDLPAHDGLWAAAVRSAGDVVVRLALVPRVLEARGLDVSPAMIERFAAAGDAATAEVLAVILRDEVGHVAIGDRWFRWVCARRGLDAEPTFRRLLAEHGVRVVPPFNVEARTAAGFSPAELTELEALAREPAGHRERDEPSRPPA